MRDFLAAARQAARSPRPDTIRTAFRHGVRVLSIPYQSGPMPAWIGPAWTIYLLAIAFQRGLDLLRTPDGRGEISAWVNVIGNTTYGTMLLVICAMLLAAAVVHRVIWLVIAHAAGAGVYVMYGIALLQGAIAAGQGNGWRYGIGMLAVAVLHVGRLVALKDELRGVSA